MTNELGLRVGVLARRTGLSVRALHHYDEIGLVRPRRRTAAGHRLYGADDVARLLRVRMLQQLGLSLDEVRACLDDRKVDPLHLLDQRLSRLREELAHGERLCQRLQRLRAKLAGQEEVSLGEFLTTIEEMTMFEKYYTPEQLQQLEARRLQVGEARLRQVQTEWPQLIAAMRAEMAKGTAPGDPRVQALAARWRELIAEFTGGDPGILQSLKNLYAGEAQVSQQHGLDAELMDFVGRAMRSE